MGFNGKNINKWIKKDDSNDNNENNSSSDELVDSDEVDDL